ncbi:MAG: hypothetical protein HRU28_01860 [Rhizobiales bacterium]|nr:hypothetical protein [Hyphomicrobiales bacterium]
MTIHSFNPDFKIETNEDEQDFFRCEHCGGLFDPDEGYCNSCCKTKFNAGLPLPDEQLVKCVVEWQGITIEIDQHVIYGDVGITGITVSSILPEKAPLPISETGFKSLHPFIESVKHHGGVKNYILAYLDHEAAKPKWEKSKNRLKLEQIAQVKIKDAAKQIDMFGGVL